MRNRKRCAVVLSLAALTQVAAAAERTVEETGEPRERVRLELHGVADLRLVGVSAPTSWLDGGFGRTRYGGRPQEQNPGARETAIRARAGQLSLVVDGRAPHDLAAHVHLNLDTDLPGGRKPLGRLGVVEAFAAWSPVLGPTTRLRVRAGITIPPFSLEHPERAWSTRYTITPSAIGSWLGEEVKSTGAEATLTIQTPGFTELQLQGGVFLANDSTGALLAWRGWALHDRQGQTSDEVPLPAIVALTDPRFFITQGTRTEPFREIDRRPGVHAQGRFRFGEHGFLQGGWYSSRGDVRELDARGYTWKTSFAVVGAELDFGPLTVLAQGMDGRAKMGFVSPRLVDAPFRAGYVLASLAVAEQHRVTFRYDRFRVLDEDVWREGKDLNDDHGWALTAAWLFDVAAPVRIAFEVLRLHAEHPFAVTAGEDAVLDQRQVQLGVRLRM